MMSAEAMVSAKYVAAFCLRNLTEPLVPTGSISIFSPLIPTKDILVTITLIHFYKSRKKAQVQMYVDSSRSQYFH